MDEMVIAGIGEVLWDVIGDVEKLGGAPINFAFHASELGAKGLAVSTVGDDQRGKSALQVLQANGVDIEHVTVKQGAVTGYVEANVDDNGVAHYSFPDDVAWDNIEIKPTTRQIAEQIDCICFGSLAQRSRASRETILEFIGLTRPDTLKIFDLNIRQEFYSKEIVSSSLELADVLKLNDEELEIVTGLFTLSGGENERIDMLKEMFSLRGVVLTKGADGSVIHFENEKSEYTGSPVNVVDTIGAGDSFTASVAVGLLSGRSLDEINRHANLVASYVCGKKGAMVNMPGSLKY